MPQRRHLPFKLTVVRERSTLFELQVKTKAVRISARPRRILALECPKES